VFLGTVVFLSWVGITKQFDFSSTKPCSVDENMASEFWEVLSGWGLALRELVYHAYLQYLKDAMV